MKVIVKRGFVDMGLRGRRGEIVTIEDDLARALIARELVAEAPLDALPNQNGNGDGADGGTGGDQQAIDVSGMNVEELKAFAVDRAIDLGEARKKDEIVSVIQQALSGTVQ